MLPLPNSFASCELLHALHIDTINARAIIRQQRRQRPSHNLAPIYNADRVAEESVPVRQDGIVDTQVLEDLYYREGRAGQDGLFGRFGIEEADVLVHVEDVLVGKAFDILIYRDDLLHILVLAPGVEDGVLGRERV